MAKKPRNLHDFLVWQGSVKRPNDGALVTMQSTEFNPLVAD